MIRATHTYGQDAASQIATTEARHFWENMTYTLRHDPTGDFRPGARFGKYDVLRMIKFGCLSDGAQISRDNGREYEVRGGELVEVGNG